MEAGMVGGMAVIGRDQRHELAEAGEPEKVSGLVRLAIEKGVDVEVLERLVALQERVTERDARARYFEALGAFQEECPAIHKSKTADIATNSGGSYKYSFAPLDQIARTIRPFLKKHGLSYSWTTEAGANAGILEVICVLRHIDGHAESARFPVPTETKAAMSGAQKVGAALTYGQRQSLVSVLGLTTTSDDVDGAEADDADGELVTPAQIDALSKRIDEVGADFHRFLTFMRVGALKEIPQRDFQKAMRALEMKRKPGT